MAKIASSTRHSSVAGRSIASDLHALQQQRRAGRDERNDPQARQVLEMIGHERKEERIDIEEPQHREERSDEEEHRRQRPAPAPPQHPQPGQQQQRRRRE